MHCKAARISNASTTGVSHFTHSFVHSVSRNFMCGANFTAANCMKTIRRVKQCSKKIDIVLTSNSFKINKSKQVSLFMTNKNYFVRISDFQTIRRNLKLKITILLSRRQMSDWVREKSGNITHKVSIYGEVCGVATLRVSFASFCCCCSGYKITQLLSIFYRKVMFST